MARRTLIIAALLFIGGAAGIVTNRDSWSTVLGLNTVPVDEGADSFDTDMELADGAPAVAVMPPVDLAVTPVAKASPALRDPPAADVGSKPDSGPLPAAATDPALQATLADLIERVERRFAAGPEVEPAPRRLTPFHTGAEALAGVSLDELIEAAERRRAGPEPEAAGSLSEVLPAEDAAQLARRRVVEASLSGILRGRDWAVCVVDGQRLKIGDLFPGTTWRVASIGEREIHLADGTDMLRKDLDSLRRASPGTGSGPGSDWPEEQN